MSVRPEFRDPILSTLATVVVFIAMFMPWGELHFSLAERPIAIALPADVAALTPSAEQTVTATGWSGAVRPGIVIPNYLVLVVAGSIACLLWLRALSIWAVPAGLLFGLAIWGLLQSGYWFLHCLVANTATPGMGALLSGGILAAMLFGLTREASAAAGVTAWHWLRLQLESSWFQSLVADGWGILAVVAGIYAALAVRTFQSPLVGWTAPGLLAWTGVFTGPLTALVWHYRGRPSVWLFIPLLIGLFIALNAVLLILVNVNGFERAEFVWNEHRWPLTLWLLAWLYGPALTIAAAFASMRRENPAPAVSE